MSRVTLLGAGLVLATALALVAPGQGVGATSERKRNHRAISKYEQVLALEHVALSKTQGLLSDKLSTREGEMKRRLRAMYKLSRANWPRLWFEPEARRESARWLGAARRVAMRDVREIEMLHDEISLADRAQARLDTESTLQPAPVPRAESLQWPVQDSEIVQEFGDYQGPSHRVILRSRGVKLSCQPHQSVFSVAAGKVRYLGPIRGLGTSLIIDHGEYTSILGNLDAARVEVGESVTRETVLAQTRGEALYLELRLAVGQRGQSVDPEPLLMAPL